MVPVDTPVLMRCDISSSILHLVTGAAVTQVLLLVLSTNIGGMVAGGIDSLHLLLFGVFDLIGGIGFAALMQRQVEPSLQVTE